MTLAEQLEQAKRRQEIADLDAGDQRTAAEFAKRISLPPLELSADIRTLLDPFNKWANQRHARRCPARPATVALFALDLAAMGVEIEQILAQLNAIEEMHSKWALPNPVRSVPVRYALETLIKTDPPRSWPRDDKVRFALLDPDTKRIIATRERQRDNELSRRLQADKELKRREVEPDCKSASESKETTDERT